MTISSRVQQQFFAAPNSTTSEGVIRLPLTLLDQIDYWSLAPLVTASLHSPTRDATAKLSNAPQRRSNLWTAQEHDRFLRGLELFPRGPWKRISAVVRTKTTRQTMTHAQKYRQKIERHMRLTKTFMHAVSAPRASRPTGMNNERRFAHGVPERPSEIESFMGCLEFDPALSALIDSLEPIDNPDAWVMPRHATV